MRAVYLPSPGSPIGAPIAIDGGEAAGARQRQPRVPERWRNNGQTWVGAKRRAHDRNATLDNAEATPQRLQLSTSYGGVLPVDLDGTAVPPPGAPAPFVKLVRRTIDNEIPTC